MPSPVAVDITALAALIAYLMTIIMQVVKPLVELIPGMLLPKNQVLHDSVLRLLLGLGNFGLLLLAAHSLPGAFAGWQWWDFVALAFGQSVVGHVTYQTTIAGKTDIPSVNPALDPLSGLSGALTPSEPVDALASQPVVPVIPRAGDTAS